MTIAVVAVQGAFLEHRRMFDSLGIASFEIRKAEDVNRHFDGLVLPGGECTVQGKLLRELNLLEPLRKKITSGMPVLGTCAGLILLAEHIDLQPDSHLATLPVTVSRNAYGRQLGSFYAESAFASLGAIPMTFIRAPYVKEVKQGVSVLAEVDSRIVAVRWKNQMGVSFHPELTEDTAVHRYFAAMIESDNRRNPAV